MSPPRAEGRLKLSDDDLLSIVQQERRQSVGFDHDAKLSASRETALNYFKGEMPDVPHEPDRSAATSSDIADAVETVLPDVVEIFIGDDVATFQPMQADDVGAAQQETDYVNHVFFKENAGFLNLYTMFKDAFLSKTGVVKFWWEEGEGTSETFTGKSAEELALALAGGDGEVEDIARSDGAPFDPATIGPDDTFDFTVKRQQPGRLHVRPVAPEDFTVAADTIDLKEATYCASRSRPRAQDLLARGIDPDIVKKLPPHTADTTADQARDTADEATISGETSSHNLHTVETVEHFIRVDADGDGKPELWRILTGGGETVLIEKERADLVQYAAVTPYITTHRFYGESLADKLIQVQRIKTALTRMALDSGYFALNQRLEIDVSQATEDTISDVLRNEPGVPVRSKGNALKPIQAGSLNFDPYAALEYHSVQGEQRTGVVRNAQGLNPDTLHDTAKGAMALMSAAQKRVRFIARIFAETGVKDLFLGMHALLRKHASKAATVRLRGDWVQVDPTQWSERNDMEIEIGLGSAGREHDLMVLREIIGFQTQAVSEQGGLQGPLVTGDNLYGTLKRYIERAGLKSVETYFSDPSKAPPQEPKPDPKAAAAQAQLQLDQGKAKAAADLEQAKASHQAQMAEAQASHAAELAQAQAEGDLAHKRALAQQQAQLDLEKMRLEHAFRREQAAAELQLRREQMAMEAQLKREQMAANAALKQPSTGAEAVGHPVELGGDI